MRLTGAEARTEVRDALDRLHLAIGVIEEDKPEGGVLTLVERDTERRLRFALAEVTFAEEGRSVDTGRRFLRVGLEDGRTFALSALGIIWAPVFVSTGPVADCPGAATFRDFDKLRRHLDHLVHDHHDGHEREALQVFMVLLAFVDGARAIGFDVSPEERALEVILKRLEDLGVSPV